VDFLESSILEGTGNLPVTSQGCVGRGRVIPCLGRGQVVPHFSRLLLMIVYLRGQGHATYQPH